MKTNSILVACFLGIITTVGLISASGEERLRPTQNNRPKLPHEHDRAMQLTDEIKNSPQIVWEILPDGQKDQQPPFVFNRRVSDLKPIVAKHPARKVYHFSETSKGEMGTFDCMIRSANRGNRWGRANHAGHLGDRFSGVGEPSLSECSANPVVYTQVWTHGFFWPKAWNAFWPLVKITRTLHWRFKRVNMAFGQTSVGACPVLGREPKHTGLRSCRGVDATLRHMFLRSAWEQVDKARKTSRKSPDATGAIDWQNLSEFPTSRASWTTRVLAGCNLNSAAKSKRWPRRPPPPNSVGRTQ